MFPFSNVPNFLFGSSVLLDVHFEGKIQIFTFRSLLDMNIYQVWFHNAWYVSPFAPQKSAI